jgi:hypothetical protein
VQLILAPARLVVALIVISGFVMVGIWIVRTFSAGRTEHEMAEAEAALGAFVATDEVRGLANDSGLMRVAHPELPQVTAPDHAFDGSAPIIEWAAHEVDRAPADAMVAPGARGIVVECRAGGALALDQHTIFLPDDRRARDPGEVAWIAFARYFEDDRFWVLPSGGSLAMERIDVRVVDRHGGRRIGRVTAEAAPPAEIRSTSELFQPHPVRVTREITLLLDDPEPAPTIALRPDELACAADVMPAMFADAGVAPRSCVLGATTECVEACMARNSAACLAAAQTMAHGWRSAAQRMDRLACIAGSAEGCVDEEELRMSAVDPPTPEESACESRVYGRLCDAGNEAACLRVGADRSAPPRSIPAADPCSEASTTEAEMSSPLWTDLGTWAFAFADAEEDIPSASEMTVAEAERLLDDAAAHVPGLAGRDAWQLAARFFDNENFHGLTMPACRRASR